MIFVSVRHSRESADPWILRSSWIPDLCFATSGMTALRVCHFRESGNPGTLLEKSLIFGSNLFEAWPDDNNSNFVELRK